MDDVEVIDTQSLPELYRWEVVANDGSLLRFVFLPYGITVFEREDGRRIALHGDLGRAIADHDTGKFETREALRNHLRRNDKDRLEVRINGRNP